MNEPQPLLLIRCSLSTRTGELDDDANYDDAQFSMTSKTMTIQRADVLNVEGIVTILTRASLRSSLLPKLDSGDRKSETMKQVNEDEIAQTFSRAVTAQAGAAEMARASTRWNREAENADGDDFAYAQAVARAAKAQADAAELARVSFAVAVRVHEESC